VTIIPSTVELNFDELDRVSGGIIVVGGFQHRFAVSHSASVLDRVGLNPQPLPSKIYLAVNVGRTSRRRIRTGFTWEQ
jgi:hypothetical protein